MINILEDLRQKHIEAFFREMRERGADPNTYFAPEYHGEVVRAAVKAGILVEQLPRPVEEMSPGEVRKIAQQIDRQINESLKFPPE